MDVYFSMYKYLIILIFVFIGCATNTLNNTKVQVVQQTAINQVVEAACGQCQFGMKDHAGCDLAVRIDGKPYFVDGTNIHEHGDEHADDGFCVVIRNANVKGTILDGRFKSESFTLIK